MNADDIKLKVAPENRQKFEEVVKKWGILAQVLGWDTLAEMYHKKTDPFCDAVDTRDVGEAKLVLQRTMGDELKEAGLIVYV